MAGQQLTLWQALTDLVRQIPFSTDKVEAALSTRLAERVEPSNEVFRFFEAASVQLADGVVISNVDLRIKRAGAHPGFLVLSVGGTCVALDQIRRHYGGLEITQAPRGRSLDEATTYTSMQPWGEMSFGFKERNRDCLAYIVFNPAK